MSASNPEHPATCGCSQCDYGEFLREFDAATPDVLEQVDKSKPLDVTQQFRVVPSSVPSREAGPGTPYPTEGLDAEPGWNAPPSPSIPHRCPLCNGAGHTSRPPNVPGDATQWTSAGTETYSCYPCKGSGVVWGSPLAASETGAAPLASLSSQSAPNSSQVGTSALASLGERPDDDERATMAGICWCSHSRSDHYTQAAGRCLHPACTCGEFASVINQEWIWRTGERASYDGS